MAQEFMNEMMRDNKNKLESKKPLHEIKSPLTHK